MYLTGLTIGDTIFIRVYDADLANTPINFSICVYTPPTNDFCANATEITITNGANCSGSITGNTQGAIGTGGCSGGTADDDVWYWFTATDTLHSIQLSNTTITSPVMEIFNSNCNGSQFECVQVTNLAHLNSLLDKFTISEYLALTIIMVLVAFKFVFQSHLLIYYVIML
ncbi:MAG: hypothetical protein IPN46_17030 [Saprospiraceae bacterium]|nr:hypothetical protein [Saprospiraceae bacterium]